MKIENTFLIYFYSKDKILKTIPYLKSKLVQIIRQRLVYIMILLESNCSLQDRISDKSIYTVTCI